MEGYSKFYPYNSITLDSTINNIYLFNQVMKDWRITTRICIDFIYLYIYLKNL